jgi:hypothetical protein
MADDSQQIAVQVPQATVGQTASQDDEDIYNCIICHSQITQPCIADLCRHRDYDFACLVNWLQISSTCPECRAPVKSVRYGSAAENEEAWATYKVPAEGRVVPLQQSEALEPALSEPERRAQIARYRRHRRDQRRRQEAERRASEEFSLRNESLERRREVYAHNLYSLHIGTNRKSGYRDLTPADFLVDDALVTKVRRWLRRELQVFPDLQAATMSRALIAHSIEAVRVAARCPLLVTNTRRKLSNAEFLMEYIIAILKTVDMQASSGAAQDLLADFIGTAHSRLLLHELRAWLRSPYESLEQYDLAVQYKEPSDGRREARTLDAEVQVKRSRGRPCVSASHAMRQMTKPHQGRPDGNRDVEQRRWQRRDLDIEGTARRSIRS